MATFWVLLVYYNGSHPPKRTRTPAPCAELHSYELKDPIDTYEYESRPLTFRDLLEEPYPQFTMALQQIFGLMIDFEGLRERNIASMTGRQPHALNDERFFDVPPGTALLISQQVLMIFKAFTCYAATIAHHYVAQLSAAMGLLLLCLLPIIEPSNMPMIWSFRGPRPDLLRDPDVHGLIHLALEKLVEAERFWIFNQSEEFERLHSQS